MGVVFHPAAEKRDTSAHAGALLIWTIATLIVSWRMPGASFLFAWPVLAALAAALIAQVAQRTRARHLAIWGATLVTAPVIVPAVYTIAVVILGLSAPGAIIISLFVPLSSWLLAPHLETLHEASRWGASGTMLFAAAISIAFGAANARPSPAHPEPSMLAYAFDVDASRAWFVTNSLNAAAGPPTRSDTPHTPSCQANAPHLIRPHGSHVRSGASRRPRSRRPRGWRMEPPN